jgi:hypothetical protein
MDEERTAAGAAEPPGFTGQHIPGGLIVKRALAAIVGVAFVFASSGLVGAQTPPPAPKVDDKKMEDKKDASMKKAPHHTAVGTVKTAGPDNVVVAGKTKGKETEWTFALNDKTKIKKAGKDVTAKDLAAGDKVTVRYMDEGGKMTAMSVNASAASKQAAKAKEEPKK